MEDRLTLKEKTEHIIEKLKEKWGSAGLALTFSTPFELLIAVILSAQCKDERVNQVTRELFKICKTPLDFVEIPLEKLEEIIRPTGYYHQKAKTIKNCAEVLQRKFHGSIPSTMADLTSLPGVGRKTAAMVLGNAYGINEGIATDRHVQRVSQRIGLSSKSKPEQIEEDLMKLLPRDLWTWFSNAVILHGRNTCKANNPLCESCVLKPWCDFYKKGAAKNG